MRNFEVASGSVTGRDHRLAGKNGHDAIAIRCSEDMIVGIVCDGCGSGSHSEVGAKIGANLIAQNFFRRSIDSKHRIYPPYLEIVRQDVVAQLRVLARSMDISLSAMVNDYFLFTIVGFLVQPKKTWIFSIGDGVFFVNGVVKEIGPFEGNEPPYLAYDIVESSIDKEQLKFKIHKEMKTEDVTSIIVGTDGIVDLMNSCDKNLPGKKIAVGTMSQFWESDLFFKNPDAIRRKLTLINRDSVKMKNDGVTVGLQKETGLLPDDTSMIVVRQKKEEE